jgi:hypothetical protein
VNVPSPIAPFKFTPQQLTTPVEDNAQPWSDPPVTETGLDSDTASGVR